ncbi:MAG: class I SAM-dependent methyltransferase [Saprospiraceae bacterium]|nr:class I SAM-dependent methyltransferase [Saprospiraceae bacterium]
MSFRWKIAQKAELKWWENYLSSKSVPEYQAWKRDYWEKFLNFLPFPIKAGATVLDAGCGPAGIFTVLNKQEVTACDPLLDQYSKKLEHFSPEAFPWTQFENVAIEKMDFEEKFDYVFCINAINHVDSLELSCRKLVKALKPNGWLVVSTDAHNMGLLKKLFQAVPGDILHPHQYNRSEYRNFLEKEGVNLGSGKLIKKELIFSYWLEWGQKK